MGRKHSVANFKGNYYKQTKVKFYRLPRNYHHEKEVATVKVFPEVSESDHF